MLSSCFFTTIEHRTRYTAGRVTIPDNFHIYPLQLAQYRFFIPYTVSTWPDIDGIQTNVHFILSPLNLLLQTDKQYRQHNIK